jgi:hypothetical protein
MVLGSVWLQQTEEKFLPEEGLKAEKN